MKKIHLLILFFLNIIALAAQETFQLAPPLLKYPSIFFIKETKVEMAFAEPNTHIHFTTNNAEPTESDRIYSAPILINKNFTTLKARVFSKIYKPSDIVEATFIKDGLPIKSVDCTPPNPKYKGDGAATLIDNQGGNVSLSSKTWLGFQSDTVEIVLNFSKKQKVKSVLLDMLQDQGSWVFLPEQVEVFYLDSKTKAFQSFGNKTFTPDNNAKGSNCTLLILEALKSIKTDKIKLKLYLLKQIPEWHAGKGQKGWIFIDEIKMY